MVSPYVGGKMCFKLFSHISSSTFGACYHLPFLEFFIKMVSALRLNYTFVLSFMREYCMEFYKTQRDLLVLCLLTVLENVQGRAPSKVPGPPSLASVPWSGGTQESCVSARGSLCLDSPFPASLLSDPDQPSPSLGHLLCSSPGTRGPCPAVVPRRLAHASLL